MNQTDQPPPENSRKRKLLGLSFRIFQGLACLILGVQGALLYVAFRTSVEHGCRLTLLLACSWALSLYILKSEGNDNLPATTQSPESNDP